jgi:uncharacterized protein (TIGR02246 family)
MDLANVRELAAKYTSAWCSQDPARVAAFFAEHGSLKINDGAPSVGRPAISAAAQDFMTAFPDMIVSMDGVDRERDQFVYRWTLTGTHGATGSDGRGVRISGHEQWTIGADGLIQQSLGHFDAAEYARQLSTGIPLTPPDRTEAIEYFFTYINKVRAGDIRSILRAQVDDVLPVFRGISEERSLHRYAPGKWSIRQVLSHVTDAERVFTYRALWFARGFDSPLPSFDQDVAIPTAAADGRSWSSHIDEFLAVRAATVDLFRHLPAGAWLRRGIASGHPLSVKALAYIVVGHLEHHLRIVKERYLDA